jgi:hypothetical protein
MKTPLVVALLAGATYFHFHNPPSMNAADPTAAKRSRNNVAPAVTIAAAPSSYDRWNTGPNAQTALGTGPDAQTALKTGPNAQTEFQPFVPVEQATWNQTQGFSGLAGSQGTGHRMSRRVSR